MTPEDARHGTPRGVWQHNRDGERLEDCPPCLDARRIYLRRRSKLRQMGRPGYLPVGTENIEKMRQARDVGVTWEAIGNDVGMSTSSVWRCYHAGAEHHVQAKTRQTLDRWQPTDELSVTGVGILRRLQALMWLGYTSQGLTREPELTAVGVCAQTLFEGLRHSRTQWHTNTTQAVAAVYDRLWNTPPPADRNSSRARTTARRRGYAPPLAWDSIDDPRETAKGVAA